jgi:hypothetical protein
MARVKLSRRLLLKRALALGVVGAGVGVYETAQKGLDLVEQHETWEEASRPNAEFLSRHSGRLSTLTLGGSFAPEQWPWEPSQTDALQAFDLAVGDLGLKQLRLGIRWSRVEDDGAIDLTAYRPFLDRCLSNGVDLCLNVGPIRTFRWPEEHVADPVLAKLERLPASSGTIGLNEPLSQEALSYVERLLEALRGEYGEGLDGPLRTIQIENEPFYPLGAHKWRMSQEYLGAVADRVDAAFPEAEILVTSAGRLNLNSITSFFATHLARDARFSGRLVSGFDFHYQTPLRDSFPVARHFDQISYASPLAPTTEAHIHDARMLGFRIEVTEAQAEPYAQFKSPGNSARDFRYVLLRCMDRVLDPIKPGLIRIWGVEELAKQLMAGNATDEHRQIVELIQAINGTSGPQVKKP